MIIGERLCELREQNSFRRGTWSSAPDCCVVTPLAWKKGHTIPAVETLEMMARPLEVPLYHFMYDGEKPPAPKLPASKKDEG